MAVGCPVITFENNATKEISGDIAIYANPADGMGIYSSVLKLLGSEKLLDKSIKAGVRRSEEFSWDRAGKETISIVFEDKR